MKPNPVKEGLKYGVIAGVITIVLLYGSWGVMSTETFVSMSTIIAFVPYIIVLLIVTGISLRKASGGVLSFADALKFAFVAYVISSLIEAVGNYVLYNLLDHELTVKTFAIAKEKTVKMLEKFGSSEADIEKATKKMDEKGIQTGPKEIILGYGLGLIWGFCKALIIALIIRREQKFED